MSNFHIPVIRVLPRGWVLVFLPLTYASTNVNKNKRLGIGTAKKFWKFWFIGHSIKTFFIRTSRRLNSSWFSSFCKSSTLSPESSSPIICLSSTTSFPITFEYANFSRVIYIPQKERKKEMGIVEVFGYYSLLMDGLHV